MSASLLNFLLLAEVVVDVQQVPAWYQTWYGILAIVLAVLLVPAFLGQSIAKSLRMKDYAWKISVVLFAAMAAGVMVWLGEFKGGIDLAGGTILVYEIDQEKKDQISESGDDLMEKLVTAVSQRIDPAGVKQVTIRRYGEEQIEIIIPKVTPEEVKLIKNTISTAGNLEFRILADPDIDTALVQFALNPPEDAESARRSPWVIQGRRIKERDQDARYSNEQHKILIDRAKDTADLGVIYNGRERARWVKVKPADIESVKADSDLVTRTTDEGQLEQLIIVGQPRAAWVKVGEIESNVAGETSRLRVPTGPGTVFRPRDDGGTDMLVVIDELDVDGSYLTRSSPGYRDGRVCVDFNFNAQGAKRFGTLTSLNIPDSGRKRRLGIVLDEELLSAPQLNTTIRESGQITGDFTEAEVNWLVGVLNAGRLPAALNREPISEQQVAPTLGAATIQAGSRAIGISLIAVLLFMPFYYRFCGFIACFALLLNLLLVLGVMVAIGAAFTLPGLAGLVLTVGMAVDANVLIFERIREEKDRGAALRMAIRNGFGRATRTIVDANLTTLITGLVLYVIGTDQIKGFAVTLILGIGMSMFTAIFCARIIFDIAERKRWITDLSMARLLGKTDIDFLGMRTVAAFFSIIVITVGLVGVYLRGTDLLDIDFRGGVRIEALFIDEQDDGEVREKLVAYSDQQPKEQQLADLKVVGAGGGNRAFVIETTQDDLKTVETAIKTVFAEQLQTNTLEFDPDKIRQIPGGEVETPSTTPAAEAGTAAEKPSSGPPSDDGARHDLPSFSLVALGDEDAGSTETETATDADSSLGTDAADAATEETPRKADQDSPAASPESTDGAETAAGGAAGATDASPDQQPADGGQDAADQPPAEGSTPAAPVRFAGGSEAQLVFADVINQETLRSRIDELITELDLGSPDYEVSNPRIAGQSLQREKEWTLKTSLSVEDTKELLVTFKSQLESDPVFASATNIGGQVAGDTQRQAFAALFASLVFIVAYIWIRFQKVTYGLAAVVALVHDVLVTLGVIALSAYFASIPGISEPLQLEAFKISLPVLAAFMTIIGYSLNDTIVVFDRIREVRGKSPDITAAMINTSVNQTLSRTLLTSLTTLIVVVILYFIGGAGIHGFAFALVVGVLVGTYSSVFVASPALLWMSRLGAETQAEGAFAGQSKAPVAG